MSSQHRFLHFITLLALIFNLISPLVSFEVSAQDGATPEVTTEAAVEEPTAIPTEVPTQVPTAIPTEEVGTSTYVVPLDPPFPPGVTVCVDASTLANAGLSGSPSITYSFADPDPTTAGDLVLLAKVVNGAEWDPNGVFSHWMPLGYHQYLNPNAETTYRIYSADGYSPTLYQPCEVPTVPELVEPVVVSLDATVRYEIVVPQGPATADDQRDPTLVYPGDEVIFTLTITNNSNGAISELRIESPDGLGLADIDWVCALVATGESLSGQEIAAGEQIECSATYVATAADATGEERSLEFRVFASAVQPEGVQLPQARLFGVPEPDATAVAIVPFALVGNYTTFSVEGGSSTSLDGGPYADKVQVFPSTSSSDTANGFDNNSRHARKRVGQTNYIDDSCKINSTAGAWVEENGKLIWRGGTWSGALGPADMPADTLPDGRAPSLGWGGEMQLWFIDNKLVASGSSATDLWVQERGLSSEPAYVYIMRVGGTEWIPVGQLASGTNGNQYPRQINIDEWLVTKYGGQQSDYAGWVFDRVRIVDTRVDYTVCGNGFNYAGADIDAVWALSSILDVPTISYDVKACELGVQTPWTFVGPKTTSSVEIKWYNPATGQEDTAGPGPGKTLIMRATIRQVQDTRYYWPDPLPGGWFFVAGTGNRTIQTTVTFIAGADCLDTKLPSYSFTQQCVDDTNKVELKQVTSDGFTIQSVTAGGNPVTFTDGKALVTGGSPIVVRVKIKDTFGWPTSLTSPVGIWVRSNPNDGTAILTFSSPPNPCKTTLVVEKTPDNGVISVGTNATFTVKVSNTGPITAKNVVLTDQLPTGLPTGWTWETPTDCSVDATNKITCNLGDIASQKSVTKSFTIKTTGTPSVCPTVINNTAVAKGTNTDQASDTGKITVNCQATKPTIIELSAYTCVIGVTTGSNTFKVSAGTGIEITSIKIRDAANNEATASPAGGGTYALPAANGSYTIIVRYTISSGYAAPDGAVTDGTAGTYRIEQSVTIAACTPAVISPPILSTSGCEGGAPTAQTLTFKPTGVGVAVTWSGGTTPTPVEGVYTFASGATGTIQITLTLPTGNGWPTGFFSSGSLWKLNQDGTAQLKTPLTLSPASCTSDVSIDKKANKTTDYYPGDIITYTVTLVNSGQGNATDRTVTDTLPSGLKYIANTATVNGTLTEPTVDGQKLTWTGITVPYGGTVTISYQVQIPNDGSVCNTIKNKATVTGVTKHASATVNVKCTPNVQIAKSVSPDAANRGGTVTWTVKVWNTGTADASYTLKDPLPAGFTRTSTLPQTCSQTGSLITCENLVIGKQTTEANPAYTLTIVGTVGTTATCGDMTNVASLYVPGKDTVAGKDDAKVFINCPGIKIVKKQVGGTFTIDGKDYTAVDPNGAANPDDYIAYEITITNTGNVSIGQADFRDLPPSGTTYVGHVNQHSQDPLSELSCHGTQPRIECWFNWNAYPDTYAPLPVKATRSVVMVVQVNEFAPAQTCSISNTATLVWAEQLGEEFSGVSFVSDLETTPPVVTKINCPGLNATKNADTVTPIDKTIVAPTDRVDAGDKVNFVITVKNTGNTVQSNVVVTDVIPATQTGAVTVVSATGDWGAGNVPVTWVTGPGTHQITLTTDIPLAGTVTIKVSYTLTQTDMDRGSVENCVSVPGDEVTDATRTENCASVTIPQNPDIAITKTQVGGTFTIDGKNYTAVDPKGAANPGDYIAYEITITNIGNVSIGYAVFSDQVPDGTTFVGHVNPHPLSELQCTENQSGVSCAFDWNFFPGIFDALPVHGARSVVMVVQVGKFAPAQSCSIENDALLSTAEQAGYDFIEEPFVRYLGTTPPVVTKVNCPGLEITKTDDVAIGDAVAPGDTFTYTMKVENTGNANLTSVVIEDTLPAGLTFVSSANDCAPDPADASLVLCDVGDMASGGAAVTVSFVVRVDIAPTTDVCSDREFVNVASASGLFGDLDVVAPEAFEYTPFDCDPGVQVSKTATTNMDVIGPDNRWDAGDTITYAITVTNTGNTNLTDVEVNDLFTGSSDALATVTWNQTHWGIAGITMGANNTPVIGLMPVAPAAGSVVTLTATYTLTQADLDTVEGTTVLNCASATSALANAPIPGGDLVPTDQCTSTDLDQYPSATLVKEADAQTVTPADDDPAEMTFTITFTNTGNITIDGATITDTGATPALPSGTWVVDVVAGAGYLADPQATAFPFAVKDLPPQASIVITLTASTPADGIELPEADTAPQWCTTFANTVTVTGTYANGDAIGTAADIDDPSDFIQGLTADSTIAVNCTGLSIVKSGPETVVPGETFNYTVTLTNVGNTTQTNLVVTDEISDLLTVGVPTLSPNSAGTCAIDPADDTTTPPTLAQVRCELATMVPGDEIVITVPVTVTSTPSAAACDDGEALTNQATLDRHTPVLLSTVVAGHSFPVDSNVVITDIECSPDVSIEKVGPATAVTPVNPIVFTITVTNTGTYEIDGLSVIDTLPVELRGLTWTPAIDEAASSYMGDDLTCVVSVDGSTITCETFGLPAYTGKLVITVTAATTDAAPVCTALGYTNEAVLMQDETTLDTSSDGVKIACVPLVEAKKVTTISEVKSVGDEISYTITVKNTGNVTLNDVALNDVLTGTKLPAEVVWVNPAGFTGTITTISIGETVTITAKYVVTQGDLDNGGTIQNCIQVANDTTTNDNCASTVVRQVPAIDLEKTSTAATGSDKVLNEGEVITYTFTVTNIGNTTITALTIADPLPGLKWTSGNTIASLAPGESVALTATYTVTVADATTGEVKNCADVTGMAPGGTEVTDQSCVTNPVTPNPTPTPPIDELPKTGTGHGVGATTMIWAAAAFMIMTLGVGAIGTRRQTRR